MRKCDPVSDGQTDRRDHRAEGLETTGRGKGGRIFRNTAERYAARQESNPGCGGFGNRQST
nr:MAG TPA: hypothetical protein [Caudoviricetes sp.]